MHKFMQTGAALAVILLLGLTVSGAQEDADDGLETNESGELIMRGATEDMSLSDVIQRYSDATGRTVVYDRSRLHGNVSFIAPRDGASFTAEEALHSALSEHRLVIMSDGVFDRIIAATEAVTMAETVEVGDLADLPPMRCVRIVYHLEHAGANAVRGALQNLTSRQGGVVNPVPGANALFICDNAENLRSLVKLIETLEAGSVVTTQVVSLQHTTYENTALAVGPITQGNPMRSGSTDFVQMSGTQDGRHVVVSGSKAAVERIVNVIKQLDQPQE